MSKLWGGRFTGKTDPLMEAFNESLSYDRRMWKADIEGACSGEGGGLCSHVT
jgi:argininosuccinate lyase